MTALKSSLLADLQQVQELVPIVVRPWDPTGSLAG